MTIITSSEIRDYKTTVLPNLEKMRQDFERFSLKDSIDHAARAVSPQGKMYSHQCRIGGKKAEEAAQKLLAREIEIANCSSFEEIFAVTECVKRETEGLGDLWSYDTALRIGFTKQVYPKAVYVQSGVIKGVKKAGLRHKGRRSIPLEEFPQPLQKMEPYKVENFLCVWGGNRIKVAC